MRHRILNYSVLLALPLCLLLCSACGGELGVPADPAELSDDEVVARYREASYAYGWFEIYNMEYDPLDVRELDGAVYYRVAREGMRDMAALRAYLERYFAPPVVASLLDGGERAAKFRDIDGALHTQLTVRSADRYAGEERFQVVRGEDASLINLLVDVERLNKDLEPEDGRQYTFVLRRTDGRWLFENFSMVR